jgi:glucose/arabinose dehydrogenase
MRNNFLRNAVAAVAVLLGIAAMSHAADKKPEAKPKAGKTRPATTKWDAMDVGPFFSSGLNVPSGPAGPGWRPALKGLSIKVGEKDEATVCFDTERLRMAAGWTGGFLKLPTGREGLEGVPQPLGELAFSSGVLPGWADKDGKFVEPKPPVKEGELVSFGPLPREWAKWRGLYVNGKKTVLSYTVGAASVLELPGFDSASGTFTRTFEVSGATGPLTLLVADNKVAADKARVVKVHGPVKSEIQTGEEGRVLVRLSDLGASAKFQVSIWVGEQADAEKARKAARGTLPDVASLTRGGPAQWQPVIETKGTLGTNDGPYVVDTITQPDLDGNPWKSWIRSSGFDFFKDGTTAALCSVSGDVWIVSGIDEKLERIKWKRFATGLFQPLGLKVVDEKIYVLGRDQITRLHDLNDDGEADFYENFNNDVAISSHYHEFCLDLHTDSKGNFYFAKGGNLGPWKHQHHGAFLRVAKDGSKLDVVAYGLRAPNGASVGPNDELTVSDNEGNWVPSSRVSLVKPGGFYGHVHTAHTPTPPTDHDKPVIWLPHNYDLDNSSGGQVWVTSDKWGPFKGDMLHTSYGACALFKVAYETVDGQVQGGAVKLPLKFESGIMRGRFNERDGQLYLCGLVVWQSKGPRTGAFHRVRYTGKPVHMPRDIRVKANGVEITFTGELDTAAASDAQNYSVEQWNYKWTQNYGSKEFSVADPSKIGHDRVDVKSVRVLSDRKTVFLEMPGVQPVNQMRVRFTLKAADGTPINTEIHNTINKVPGKG